MLAIDVCCGYLCLFVRRCVRSSFIVVGLVGVARCQNAVDCLLLLLMHVVKVFAVVINSCCPCIRRLLLLV